MKKILGVMISIVISFSNLTMAIDMNEAINLQKKMEASAQKVLDQYIGKQKSIVSVIIKIRTDKIEKSYAENVENNLKNQPMEYKEEKQDDTLPGYSHALLANDVEKVAERVKVYDNKSYTVSRKQEVILRDNIDKIFVNVVVDKSVSKEKVENVKQVVSQVLKLDGVNNINVLTLDIYNYKEQVVTAFSDKVKNYIKSDGAVVMYLKYGIILLSALIILLLGFFFTLIYTTFANRKRQQEIIMNASMAADQAKTKKVTDNEILDDFDVSVLESENISPKAKQVIDDSKLFGFVTEENAEKIVFLVKGEPVEKKIAVLNFVSKEVAAKLMSLFDAKDRREIILNARKELLLKKEEIIEFENELKSQIEFLTGGKNFTLSMFDFLSNELSEEILKDISKTDKKIAEEVANSLYVFEDILKIDKKYIQMIVKKLGEKEFSYALNGCSEEFIKQVKSNLSEGVVEMLSQSLRLLKNIPKSKVAEAKYKVVMILKQLNKEELIPAKAKLAA